MAEADYLVDIIQKYGFTPDKVNLPIFCDWEGLSYEWNKNQGIEITPAQLQEMTEIYYNRLIARGYKAGVYLSKNFWDNWYGRDYFEKHPQFYIWYARPGYATPDRECYLWQYDCDIGLEFGADEPLDKNVLLGEYVVNVPLNTESESYKKLEEELVNVRCELETAMELLATQEKLTDQLKAELTDAKVDVAKLTEENRMLKGILDEIEKLVEERK